VTLNDEKFEKLQCDRFPSISVARTTVVIKNLSIVVSAFVVCFMLAFPDAMATVWNGWLHVVCQGVVVFFADVSYLATTGNVIAIERDWVVEISGQNTKVLASKHAQHIKGSSPVRIACDYPLRRRGGMG
jgi:hypothetical protein